MSIQHLHATHLSRHFEIRTLRSKRYVLTERSTDKKHRQSSNWRIFIYGQWSVVSGQWSVVSGQWSAVSGQRSAVRSVSETHRVGKGRGVPHRGVWGRVGMVWGTSPPLFGPCRKGGVPYSRVPRHFLIKILSTFVNVRQNWLKLVIS